MKLHEVFCVRKLTNTLVQPGRYNVAHPVTMVHERVFIGDKLSFKLYQFHDLTNSDAVQYRFFIGRLIARVGDASTRQTRADEAPIPASESDRYLPCPHLHPV